MKPSDGQILTQAFLQIKGLSITTNHTDNKITGWSVNYKGKVKEFVVKAGKILSCWKEVENYLTRLK